MEAIEFHAVVKNGAIEIPPEHRDALSGKVVVSVMPESKRPTGVDLIDAWLDRPRRVPGFIPLTREEANAR